MLHNHLLHVPGVIDEPISLLKFWIFQQHTLIWIVCPKDMFHLGTGMAEILLGFFPPSVINPKARIRLAMTGCLSFRVGIPRA